MIKVKTINIKYVWLKLIFYAFIIVTLCIVIKLLMRFGELESRTFASELVKENIKKDVTYAKGNLNFKILSEELGVDFSKIGKTDTSQEKNIIIDDKIENEGVFEIENKYISNSAIKMWDRAKKYDVTEESGKVRVGNTVISNYSGLKLDLAELSKVSTFPINDDTDILIFHTHTSEAYSESGKGSNFRSLDDSINVVSVGNALKQNLLAKRFNVKHCTTKHDTPSYNDSYNSSLKSVQAEFEKYKYDIVLDVHRDALSGNLNYRPTAEINGESAAKLMFVVGTNGSGLKHDNWMENLKLALLIQNTANEMYPGLFRDLNLSKYRYNENVCDGALILEVGATGNTLEEVWNSMKYFSNVIESLKE